MEPRFGKSHLPACGASRTGCLGCLEVKKSRASGQWNWRSVTVKCNVIDMSYQCTFLFNMHCIDDVNDGQLCFNSNLVNDEMLMSWGVLVTDWPSGLKRCKYRLCIQACSRIWQRHLLLLRKLWQWTFWMILAKVSLKTAIFQGPFEFSVNASYHEC